MQDGISTMRMHAWHQIWHCACDARLHALSCAHAGTDCAQKLVEAGEPCPICGATLSRSNVKLVHLLQPSSKCRVSRGSSTW
jgi:hypothetical protein